MHTRSAFGLFVVLLIGNAAHAQTGMYSPNPIGGDAAPQGSNTSMYYSTYAQVPQGSYRTVSPYLFFANPDGSPNGRVNPKYWVYYGGSPTVQYQSNGTSVSWTVSGYMQLNGIPQGSSLVIVYRVVDSNGNYVYPWASEKFFAGAQTGQ